MLLSGNPLQYFCLENPRDGGAWWATVLGVAKSQTRLSNFTFTYLIWESQALEEVALATSWEQRFAAPCGSALYLQGSLVFSSLQLLSHVRLCDPMDCGTPGFPVLQASLVLHCPKLCIFKSQTLIQDLCSSLIQNGRPSVKLSDLTVIVFKSGPQWSLYRKPQKRFSTPLSNGMEPLAQNVTNFHPSTPHGSLLALYGLAKSRVNNANFLWFKQ